MSDQPATSETSERTHPKNAIRFLTATSLFDGHDAAINIIRRLLQTAGVEVIHLGHNRSVQEVVDAAIEEDVQGIAVSSYQGGHMEYFRFMLDLLRERGAGHVKVFGGGGGVIVPREQQALHEYGVCRIYSPEDGRRMGLDGIIADVVARADFDTVEKGGTPDPADLARGDFAAIARAITCIENSHPTPWSDRLPSGNSVPVIGLTGTGGSGKSTVTDELMRLVLVDNPESKLAVVSMDPTKRRWGGALLGDRIRMNSVTGGRVFMRSIATRGSNNELSAALDNVLGLLKCCGFDLIFVETSGIGQGDAAIVDHCDLSIYVMTSEYGAATQLEKIDMLDYADLVLLNKFEKRGAVDALRDVRKQVRRAHSIPFSLDNDDLPVFGTIASRFNDPGLSAAYHHLLDLLNQKVGSSFSSRLPRPKVRASDPDVAIIPAERERYLDEIADCVRRYHQHTTQAVAHATRWYRLAGALEALAGNPQPADDALLDHLQAAAVAERDALSDADRDCILAWPDVVERYKGESLAVTIRDVERHYDLAVRSLAGTRIPKIALPGYSDWGDILRWVRRENIPGAFPYTAGVFPFKRVDEDPTRQFAGEGPPDRTNQRFHLLTKDSPAARLSTAFDSVTLYGEDPHERPDIFGKVGESGVSICTLEDMRLLFAGFDLCDPNTSVSMTINGPAPIILAFFFNVAIDQQLAEAAEREGRDLTEAEIQEVAARTLERVRGTVQADILKEDQAQNTCIFSTEFALRMMGDVQAYFTQHGVRNFYSVSISGYHIAEAGANPITQLAFTLANGFTYVEYYLSRGMPIDAFAPNLSFFFSNGLDPEYSVLGRVARRIWSIAIRDLYKGDSRSQKLKYHIQTSGRSLHAQEVDFNDIRTTLQALLAIYDNCNSLHTNAYDEAVTTPTEESVRRALAIQLIINKEFGMARNENPSQGSFVIEELTDLVEQAVLAEFEQLSKRGGVLGAMETQYQRGKIQDESMTYELGKHSGKLPIIGVNTFLNPDAKTDQEVDAMQLTRATPEEKQLQLHRLRRFQAQHADELSTALDSLKRVATSSENIFAELMQTVRVASLGQIVNTLYEVGGQYRRNL